MGQQRRLRRPERGSDDGRQRDDARTRCTPTSPARSSTAAATISAARTTSVTIITSFREYRSARRREERRGDRGRHHPDHAHDADCGGAALVVRVDRERDEIRPVPDERAGPARAAAGGDRGFANTCGERPQSTRRPGPSALALSAPVVHDVATTPHRREDFSGVQRLVGQFGITTHGNARKEHHMSDDERATDEGHDRGRKATTSKVTGSATSSRRRQSDRSDTAASRTSRVTSSATSRRRSRATARTRGEPDFEGHRFGDAEAQREARHLAGALPGRDARPDGARAGPAASRARFSLRRSPPRPEHRLERLEQSQRRASSSSVRLERAPRAGADDRLATVARAPPPPARDAPSGAGRARSPPGSRT